MHKPSRLKSAYNKVMEKLALNPDVSVTRLFAFKLALGIGLVGALTSTLVLIYCSNLQLDLTYKGFNHFFVVFKFPVSVLAAMLSVIGLIALAHRSGQSAKQIVVSESQNRLSNYYTHLTAFCEFVQQFEGTRYSQKDARNLHSLVFDKAPDDYTPRRFLLPNLTLLLQIFEKSSDAFNQLLENSNVSYEAAEVRLIEIIDLREKINDSDPLFAFLDKKIDKLGSIEKKISNLEAELRYQIQEIVKICIEWEQLASFEARHHDEVASLLVNKDLTLNNPEVEIGSLLYDINVVKKSLEKHTLL